MVRNRTKQNETRKKHFFPLKPVLQPPYCSHIVHMPLNLAVLSPASAAGVHGYIKVAGVMHEWHKRTWGAGIMALALLLLLQMLLVSPASASHFYGGTVTFTHKGRNADGTHTVRGVLAIPSFR